MNVLLLAHAFPPYNASGSVRAAKLAEFLCARGHDVRVITGAPHAYQTTLATTFPVEHVITTTWARIEAPLDWVRKQFGGGVARGGAGGSTGGRASLARRAVVAYRSLLSWPDQQAGWIRPAIRAGRKLFAIWRPDLIYSTALPFSSHIVAARLARHAGCPWVGEYRDLFSGNPYNELWAGRRRLDARFERRVLRTASCVVSVSAPLTEELIGLHGKPGHTTMNGFDPGDIARAPDLSQEFDAAKVNIVYTGIIYPGRRDPSVLFEALRRLGDGRRQFSVRFYGPGMEAVAEAAKDFGVGDVVEVFPSVPYANSLGLQAAADALLLLLWDSPLERGVLTGKLFEYVGVGRPIIALGCTDGAAAHLVRERALGLSTSDPTTLASYLEMLATAKRHTGGTQTLVDKKARLGLSRMEQFELLEAFLARQGLLGAAKSKGTSSA